MNERLILSICVVLLACAFSELIVAIVKLSVFVDNRIFDFVLSVLGLCALVAIVYFGG